ncbi:RsmB/NOP family class I SAM-dependent RNA methyltransferase [Octadecabacter antarcticus]|nr:RsmB/NOP family class I SAM-dependent RNA methyltransferase [Octadecabacter antarcticus]
MTPAARVAAAIEILEMIFDGATPEKSLTGWGRRHRFAGSKDRAAIRDHVFQALRCRASYGWLGSAETGRGVMLGAMRAAGQVDEMFSGIAHAPRVVEEGEDARALEDADRATKNDMPAWLLPYFDSALGDDSDGVMEILKTRAGVFLRVNAARTDTMEMIDVLAQDGVTAVPVADIKNALQVTENERRVAQSDAYLAGLIELQDASSQHAMIGLGLTAGQRVLDLCAGGGGKALAMAALGADVTAHDIDPRRMVDLAPRAERAGVVIETVSTDQLSTLVPFDVVLVDAPCSGSGTWRRTPAAKWDLTPERLLELTQIQDDVLAQAATLVGSDGTLAYATCSVFDVENIDRIQDFIKTQGDFKMVSKTLRRPCAGGDGFFIAQLCRTA